MTTATYHAWMLGDESRPALPIPRSADDLTAGWLTAALDISVGLDGVRIVDATVTPVGTGQMCDSARVTPVYGSEPPPGAPRTLVAKQPAADPTSRATGLALRSYEAEVSFYRELAGSLPVRTPHVFHADIDLTTGDFVLLLEDMAPAHQGDQLAGCTPDEARLALDEVVKLHAPRWGDPALTELEWLYRDPDASRGLLGGLIPASWSGFTDRYVDRLGPEVVEAGESLIGALDAFLAPPPAEHVTVVHGDYRLDNLLFGQGAGAAPIAVVDWQTVSLGLALTDVAYFIGAGLLPDVRRAHEDDLVQRYHAAVVAAGVDGYDWARCWNDYRRGTFAGLVMAVCASLLVERTERGDEMFMTMAHRHAAHILDVDAPAVLAAGA